MVLERPKSAGKMRKTDGKVIKKIDQLLDKHSDHKVAENLNEMGCLSGTGNPFNTRYVARLRKTYDLKSHYDRLREAGMLTIDEIAFKLDTCPATVGIWRRNGVLKYRATTVSGDYLYEDPGDNAPVKYERQK
jgi:hypothetical protein